MTKEQILYNEHQALDEALEWMLECDSAERVASFVEGLTVMTNRILRCMYSENKE